MSIEDVIKNFQSEKLKEKLKLREQYEGQMITRDQYKACYLVGKSISRSLTLDDFIDLRYQSYTQGYKDAETINRFYRETYLYSDVIKIV